MKLCILGWYGTETLGDRAILDGIIRIFTSLYTCVEVSIGSLYPLVTERTIFEDSELYGSHTKNLVINTFDVRDNQSLKRIIKESDLIAMGGGPLMNLSELYIIKYAFRYAKKQHKATALLGCGYGPLTKKEYIKCVGKIVKYSDLVIMRSKECYNQMRQISDESCLNRIYYSLDPAAISVMCYRESFSEMQPPNTNVWIMNIRDLDYVYSKKEFYYPKIKEIVKIIANQVPSLQLMPMHTFCVGGDDRMIQNRIKQDINISSLNVIQKPLSLMDAYDLIICSPGCIGMRYHSILFQTYLNGNNYIIDYTDVNFGKVKSFLTEIDRNSFYKKRYMHIDDDLKFREILVKKTESRFSYDRNDCSRSLEQYRELISKVLEKKL